MTIKIIATALALTGIITGTIFVLVPELTDTTPDWSAPDAQITERDKKFNHCVSRNWDGLDWEGSSPRNVAWGTSIGNYCLDSLNNGYENEVQD